MNHGPIVLATLAIGLLGLAASVALGEDSEPLTIDWIHGDEAKELRAGPTYSWIGAHELLRYDTRPDKNERTLEVIDAETGEITLVVDAKQALASLPPDSKKKELGRPSLVDASGRRGLYEHEKDLYVLDFESSQFRRLTQAAGSEKSARFSPDGQTVVFVRENDLYAVDVKTLKERRLTHDGDETTLNGALSWVYWEELFGRRDRGFEFSPDGKRLAYLQFDDSPVDVMTYVDPRPDATKLVRQRYPKAGTPNPKVRAGVLDLATGKTIWIDLGAHPYEYLVRVQWHPASDRLIVQTLDRPQQRLDVFVADAVTGSVRHILREEDPAWIDVHDDLVFLPDGRRFVWRSDRAGNSHLFLYELRDANPAHLVRQLTEGEWAVSRGATRVDGTRGAIVAVDSESVTFMAAPSSHLELHLCRVGLDGKGATALTSAPGSHGVAVSRDGKFVRDAHSSIERPPATDLLTIAGKTVRRLIEPSSVIHERFGLGRPTLTVVKTSEGYELPASVLLPKGFEEGRRYPAVVSVYGGPAAPVVRNAWAGRLADHLLATNGFVVFKIDPRTSTRAGKSITRGVVRRFYGDAEIADILAGVRWLKSQSYVDPDRVGIQGWSGGGTTTVMAMTRSTEFRAGIAGAGVYDWRLYDTIYTERYMKRPKDNPEGYAEVSPVSRAKDLHGALLLLHGTADDNVHAQNSWRLAEALVQADIPFEFMPYVMRKHGLGDKAARRHSDRLRLRFWLRELTNER